MCCYQIAKACNAKALCCVVAASLFNNSVALAAHRIIGPWIGTLTNGLITMVLLTSFEIKVLMEM